MVTLGRAAAAAEAPHSITATSPIAVDRRCIRTVPGRARTEPCWRDPLSALDPDRSGRISHQLGDVWHWIRFPISNCTSAAVKPAFRVALGLHAFGDGFPVVVFDLIHGNNQTLEYWVTAEASVTRLGRDDRLSSTT